jgi:hypothetical protein
MNESLVWTKIGNQGDSWLNGKVNLYSDDLDYTITFEGVRGTSYLVGKICIVILFNNVE